MKILVAGLLCYFISAICGFESNSSLLESKSLPESSSSEVPSAKLLPMALYVVIIWKQEFERTQPYVHCFAAVLEIDKLITTHQCAFEIVEAFDSHKNFKFPQFSATIGDLSHDTKISLEILRPLIHEELAMSTQIATIIPLSEKINLPGINETNNVPYRKEHKDELKFFTLGLRSNRPVHYKDDVKKIELQPLLDGFVTNKQILCYDPVEGSPLYEDGNLLGIYTEMTKNLDQNKFHPQVFVYKFLILKGPDSPEKKDKKKKSKKTIIQNQSFTIGSSKTARNVGIHGFGNRYYQ